MSAIFRRKGDKHRYRFVDGHCIGRECWAPGLYQHRGATLAGSRNTGAETPCCMRNAYHGCPIGPDGERREPCSVCNGEAAECKWCNGTGQQIIAGRPEFQTQLAGERIRDGWRRA